jgi:Domain of unknown function (DUF6458)
VSTVRADDKEDGATGIGVSIFLIAVGAILAFAVTAEFSGIDIEIVGWILMAAGGLGLLLSLIFWSSWGGWRRRDAYDGRPPPY